ncbi:hypothetical protein B484DRAFT_329750 [Ochromonadaceae sp. CCMP2298]|nr:hypothetical protein B484DRAFT_329750 [Ochromonadaceae sp. CCMP2298]
MSVCVCIYMCVRVCVGGDSPACSMYMVYIIRCMYVLLGMCTISMYVCVYVWMCGCVYKWYICLVKCIIRYIHV